MIFKHIISLMRENVNTFHYTFLSKIALIFWQGKLKKALTFFNIVVYYTASISNKIK